MKQFDVTALGELLIDFTQNGLSNQGNYLMEANPCGAPCNVLSMLTKLGKKTAFIGKVGDDFLGRHLKAVVEEVATPVQTFLISGNLQCTLDNIYVDSPPSESLSDRYMLDSHFFLVVLQYDSRQQSLNTYHLYRRYYRYD